MKYDWITIAIDNGGVVILLNNGHGYYLAEMKRSSMESIKGEYCTTIPDALTSLNCALQDDAAEECKC